MSRIVRIMIYLTVMFFIIIPTNVSASIDSFNGLEGNPESGKVKIELGSFKSEDGKIFIHPDRVRINAGEISSYIPVIRNVGENCDLRIRLYATSGDKKIDITKYCFGFEDNWDFEKGWFYYKKEFEKNETVKICDGFTFPDEWEWKACNILDVTVEAEAIADKEANIVRTGDGESIYMIIVTLLLVVSFALGLLLIRRFRIHGKQNI